MRRSIVSNEAGSALVVALMLMAVMATSGFALYSVVDTQTQASRVERERETAFTLTESAFNAEVFALARDWPGVGMATNPYPTCAPTSTSARCPSNQQLLASFPSPDAATGTTWSTSVHDNGGAGPDSSQSYYDDTITRSQPGYDANADGTLWVRAQATVRSRTRTIVALVRAEQQDEDVPHAALIAGSLSISNMGNKTIVDASSSGTQHLVMVRCVPQQSETTPCLGHKLSDMDGSLDWFTKKPQIVPLPTTANTGYTGGPALSAEARARLKATAIANGTYFTGCPSASQLSGRVVYIEAGDCSYAGNTTFNSATGPGLVIIASGSLYLGGTTTFHGIVYAVNPTDSSGWAVQLQGDAEVLGGVLVDGNGQVIAGSSKENIVLDLSAYNAVRSYGSAGVIQNTWREIKGR
jgi:Tfp pilus assembly protein PilX